MSKSEMLRVLVNERLTVAAEEIFALFERALAEYEEELCRSKEENQQRFGKVLSPGVLLPKEGARVYVSSPSSPPGPRLSQDIRKTAQFKDELEEQGVKQEEEQLPVSVPELTAVCVKREESSSRQQRQANAFQVETHVKDTTAATVGHGDHCFDMVYNEDWELPFSCPAAENETEADGVHFKQVQITDRSIKHFPQNLSTQEMGTSAQCRDMSRTAHGTGKKYQCSVCTKQFWTKQDLQRHIRVHTGERPYSCSLCQKTFALKGALNVHRRRHTDKPCSCPVCNKEFTNSCNLKRHIRTHTGEKPYSCSFCSKEFNQSSNLKRHMRIHIEDRPELHTEWLRDVSCVQVPI